MKKILHIETFPFSPHLETSAEIAITNSKKHKNYFFWCGYDLPWVDWELPIIKKVIGMNYDNKIKKIEKILKKSNIKIIKKFDISSKDKKYIDNWAARYDINKKLINIKYKSKNLGIGVLSSFVSIYQNENFNEKENIIKSALISSALVFERTKKLIEIIKPDEIVTFNNRFALSLPILEVAKNYNIKYHCHERGSRPNKYQIFEKSVHDVDERGDQIFKLWKNTNIQLRNKFGKKYFDLPFTTSKINFNLAGTKKNLSLNQNQSIELDKNKKKIVFFCSSNHEFHAISNDFNNDQLNKIWSNQIKAIRSVIKVLKKISNYQFILRVHPSLTELQDEKDTWAKFKKNKQIKIIDAESKINSFDLLKKADIVISYGSSLAVHAVYNGKTSISLRKHVFSKSGLILHPKNEKELLNFLIKKNKRHDKKKCYPYGNYLTNFGIKYKHFKPHKLYKGYLNNQIVNHYGLPLNFILSMLGKVYTH